jgi:hypothetical protein
MTQTTKNTGAVAPLSADNALDVFTQMLAMVPDAPESDGSEILARIMESDDIDDAGAQTSLPAAKDLVGKRFLVHGITKNAADEGMEGLPFYVIVDATDKRTGEVVRWQTSAKNITAWLVKLHLGNAFPADIEITSAKTRSGREAVDCKIHGSSGKPAKLTPTA